MDIHTCIVLFLCILQLYYCSETDGPTSHDVFIVVENAISLLLPPPSPSSFFTSPLLRPVFTLLDKPAKSVSRDALLPLQYASWSSEGTVLVDHWTGPSTHTSARYVYCMFRDNVHLWRDILLLKTCFEIMGIFISYR